MFYKSFTTVTASSTIIEDKDRVVKITPIYPVFNSKNSSSFTLAEALPKFIKLDGKEFITYPLKPNTEINLISLTASEDGDLRVFSDSKIIVKDVMFYIGGDDPFGISIPYSPEFEFKEVDYGLSMRLCIDEPVECHGPSYVIKGRMKGEARLSSGFIKVWMEDVKVTDENGKDISSDFRFSGYTVEGSIISIKPNNQ